MYRSGHIFNGVLLVLAGPVPFSSVYYEFDLWYTYVLRIFDC